MQNFLNPDYLGLGNLRQREAHQELVRLGIFEILAQYNPVLTGTIPIALDLPESDLDIICECHDHDEFESLIIEHYGKMTSFEIYRTQYHGVESTVAKFVSPGFEIEIFGQNVPVEEQNAYRHMLIEFKLLNHYGDEFRSGIMKLKRQGYKTEPAFAKMLGLHGDPYKELLNLVI